MRDSRCPKKDDGDAKEHVTCDTKSIPPLLCGLEFPHLFSCSLHHLINLPSELWKKIFILRCCWKRIHDSWVFKCKGKKKKIRTYSLHGSIICLILWFFLPYSNREIQYIWDNNVFFYFLIWLYILIYFVCLYNVKITENSDKV